MTRPIAALLTLAGILSATEAKAQHFFRRGIAQPSATAPATTSSTAAATAPATGAAASARVYSYSYYSRSALPARTYVGYGTTDFPFHGVPYGHAYDPYTWAANDRTSGSILARYYDPPVK
jgi:hypothetical protein